jgi:hypothetical protein
MSEPTAPTPPPAQPATQPPAKQRGCFFYGCITVLILTLVMGVAGFFVARHLLNKFVTFAEQYTETNSMALPKVQMSAVDYAELDKRIAAFRDGLNAQKAGPALVLTGEDINALIANDPNWKELNGKVHVTIAGDRITGQVSIPLGEFAGRVPGLSRLKSRYLNGSAAWRVALANGRLAVTLQSLEANGQSPPPQIMAQLQSVNFAQNAQDDPKAAALIARLASIEVKDGTIKIKARANE